MHGIGKTQLALRFAKRSFDQLRYSHIFRISGSTVKKLNQSSITLMPLHSTSFKQTSLTKIHGAKFFSQHVSLLLRQLSLGLPKVEDATSLLFAESDTDVTVATTQTKSMAEDVVKFVGRLPLAISHAASFMK
jgi:hypothetical protein